MIEESTSSGQAIQVATPSTPAHPSLSGDASAFQRITTSNWFLGAVVGIVALSLGLYQIGVPSLWFDELLSVSRAQSSLPVLWRIVNTSQPNMALYYYFLHFWLQLTAAFGLLPTEAVVRFPSAVFAASASVIVFLLARRYLGLLAGLCGAGLYLSNTLQLIYTQETRTYGLQLFLICLGWYALLKAITSQDRQRRWLVLYVIMMTLSVYTHFFSLLILTSQGIGLIILLFLPTVWRAPIRRLFKPLFISLVSIGILIIPMLIASRAGSQTDWIPIPHPRDVYNVFLMIGDHDAIYLWTLMLVILFGLVCALLFSHPSGQRLLQRFSLAKDDTPGTLTHSTQGLLPLGLMLLCWLIFPVVSSYIISQLSVRLFLYRYLVTIVPPFFLLVALGVHTLSWRVSPASRAQSWRLIQVIASLFLLALALFFVPNYYASAQVEEWNTGSRWVAQNYRTGDGIICYSNFNGCELGLDYYFQITPTQAHFDPDSPAFYPWSDYDQRKPIPDPDLAADPTQIQRYAAKHQRIFYVVAHLALKSQDAKAQAAINWLNAHYKLTAVIKTHTITAYLFDVR